MADEFQEEPIVVLGNPDTDGDQPGGDSPGHLEDQPPDNGQGDPGTGDPQKPTLKYKNHEEAEAAYKELERKLGEQGRELERLRRQPPSFPQQPIQQERPEHRIADEAVRKINALTDEERATKGPRIWAEAQAEIARTVSSETTRQQEASRRQMEYIDGKAFDGLKDLGLTKGDALSAFWSIAGGAPKHLPLDEQIGWAVDRVKAFVSEVVKQHTTRQNADEEARRKASVMGKGSTRRTPQGGGDEGPVSLADGFKAAANSRRVQAQK